MNHSQYNSKKMCSEHKKHSIILFLKFVVEKITNTYKCFLMSSKGRIKREISSDILLKPLFSASVKKDHIITDF